MRRWYSILIILVCAALACSLGNPAPTPLPTAGVTVEAFPQIEILAASETPTPIPTATPSPTLTAVPTLTPTLPPTDTPSLTPTLTLTSTALIHLASPTATLRAATAKPKPTNTSAPTNTAAAPAAPLIYRGVSFVSARLDPARPPDGSFTTLSVEFAGSRPPYTIVHDHLVSVSNPNGNGTFENAGVVYTYIHFTILKTCGGPIVATLTLIGGDGQQVTGGYWIDQAPCT
jgi:hypothetical protein